jgi:hypothetical protein
MFYILYIYINLKNMRPRITKIKPQHFGQRVFLPAEERKVSVINELMKKHNISLPLRLSKYLSESEYRNEYLKKISYYIKKKATLKQLKNIEQLFDNEKIARHTLKNTFYFKKRSLENVGVKYTSSFFISDIYVEYDLLYKNLLEINREILEATERNQQQTLIGLFFPDVISKGRNLQKLSDFLKQYEKLIKEIYLPVFKGHVKESETQGIIKHKNSTYRFSIEGFYFLKTKVILEEIVSVTKGHFNKQRILGLMTDIISKKRNISLDELSLIGETITILPTERFEDVVNKLEFLFEDYLLKTQRHEETEKTSQKRMVHFKKTKAQKQIEEKRSLYNLLKKMNDFMLSEKNPKKRYEIYEQFVNAYIGLKKIYDPETIIQRIK